MPQARSQASIDDSRIDESGRAAIGWMVALTSGGMTERQLRDFDRWRDASPANAAAWNRMSGGLQPFDALARSGLPRGSISRLSGAPRRDRRAVLAGLAGLVAVGGAGTVGIQRFVPLEDLLSDHYTRTAEHGHFQLSDDSDVVLAPRSSLNVALTPEIRMLAFVHGRMRLDVAANDPRPFVVGLGQSRLEASGGAFVVDRHDKRLAVTGLRGVGTLRFDDGRRLPIGASERVAFNGSDLTRGRVDADVAASWVSGFAVFRDESVGSIVDQIRPYFPGFIRLSADSAVRRATGVFNLFEPVMSLNALARSVDLEMTRTAGFLIRINPIIY